MLEENKKNIKWPERVTTEVLELIGEKKFTSNMLRKKVNWVGHILRRNCLLHDDIEGQMTEVRIGRRRTHFLDDLRNIGR